jgi:rhodanese-related sulfurtransferase
VNPGSFANEFEPIDFVNRDIHSFLRNETIARVLYLCKDVETFGSGIRKIYSLCNTAGVEIKYENTDTDFKIEFSRIDRNKSPLSGHENGRINDQFRSYNSMDSCDSPEALPDCDQIILSCGRTGNRSGQAAEKLAAMGHTNTYELGEQNLGEIILAKKGFARDNPALPEVDSSRPAIVKSGKISIERL